MNDYDKQLKERKGRRSISSGEGRKDKWRREDRRRSRRRKRRRDTGRSGRDRTRRRRRTRCVNSTVPKVTGALEYTRALSMHSAASDDSGAATHSTTPPPPPRPAHATHC